MASGVQITLAASRIFHRLSKHLIKDCQRCFVTTNYCTYRHLVQQLQWGQAQHLMCNQIVKQRHIRPPPCIGVRFSSSSNSGNTTDPHLNPEPSGADPLSLVRPELQTLCDDIRQELSTWNTHLRELVHYHFDGEGKAFRPMIVLLMAKALNTHNAELNTVLAEQKKVAEIAEMIHVASLIHDDVIDEADTRRGKSTVQNKWGQKQAIYAGDFIMSAASVTLARIRNEAVVTILTQVLEDLVRGEFMQLGSKEDETERFNHYLLKTYKKTASLVANSCKAVAVLGESSAAVIELAYQYGRNVGIAFQLVDDLLDFTSSEALMGKPTAADLKLGLATAPVLFAAHQFPELNQMIMRRFAEEGDVDQAFKLVSQSDGVHHTRYLAEQHCGEAVRHVRQLRPSPERNALISLTDKVLNRLK